MTKIQAVILDVDGTLVDSNEAHAQAWVDTFTAFGYDISFEQVRPLIGMGSDQLLPKLLGLDKESEEGRQLSERRSEIFKTHYLPGLEAFPDVPELLNQILNEGLELVVASSAKEDELAQLLKIAGVDELIPVKTSADDAKASKPAPDIVQVALDKAGFEPGEVLMLADTPYDLEAATRAGVGMIGLRCGGWDDQALRGCLAVYDDPADLLTRFETSPLAVEPFPVSERLEAPTVPDPLRGQSSWGYGTRD
jgi:phosphoglycolate phosphatase-like HAD superfamily hydrolase